MRKRSQGDNRGDGVKWVLFAVARRNQAKYPTPGIEANLLIEVARPSAWNARACFPSSLAEHRSDQPVEKVDCLICQAGSKIERDDDQGGMSARALVSSHVLHATVVRPASRAELGEMRLMNAMAASRLNADRPDVNQTLDQAQHCQSGFVASGIWRSHARPALAVLSLGVASAPSRCRRRSSADNASVSRLRWTSRRAW